MFVKIMICSLLRIGDITVIIYNNCPLTEENTIIWKNNNDKGCTSVYIDYKSFVYINCCK